MLNSTSKRAVTSSPAKLLQLVQKTLCAAALFGLSASLAHAVPSYARQTGSDCASCHVGSYGPQLTPYGVKFKLGGYTDSDGQDGKIPLSAMTSFGVTQTGKAPADGSAHKTNSTSMETSLFVAGRLTDNIGIFSQATTAYNERTVSLDLLDLRYARSLKLGDNEATIGLSLNNNPTLGDPFNALSQWRFPYIASKFGQDNGVGAPSPLVESLAAAVYGLNAYTFINNSFYAEGGLYNTPSRRDLVGVNGSDMGKFKGLGYYGRVAYFKDLKRQNFSVGLLGFNASLQPDRQDQSGLADKYTDLGIDASYQFLGNREHIFTVNTSYIKEWQTLNFTNSGLGSDNLKNSIKQFRLAGSYTYNQTWGLTTAFFDTRGTTDATLYSGSLNGSPTTTGYILQADWTPLGKESSWGAPFANVRLGVQYTGYTKYMGGSTYNSLDVNGGSVLRNAKDNNTLMLFLWTSI
jgi:hypothetical protein